MGRKKRNSALNRNSAERRKIMRKLLDKYHWVCHLCEQPIDPDLFGRVNHPMAPSLDHLVSRANGGHSRQSNLKPAHRKCNSERGD